MRFPCRVSLVVVCLALPVSRAAPAAVRVVTTTTDLRAIAAEVAGPLAEVSSIAAGNQDPHFVDAKPSFLVRLGKADLFVMVGMELEGGWAPNLLLNSRNPRIQKGADGFVDASVGIAPLQVPTEGDRSMGDIHPFGNPHYWLDPANGKVIARNVAEGLKRVDPTHAADYDRGLAAFRARLDEGIARWTAAARALDGVPVVAYHNSWPYFERRFGFRVEGFVEPKPGIPPSGKYLAELVASMKAKGVKLILMSPFYSAKTADLVAKESGARVVTLANSVEGLPEASGYVELFDRNVALLAAAAKGE